MSRVSNFIVRHLSRRNLILNLDRPIVSFTFDDIPKSAVDVGASTLDMHGMKGTFYVSPGLIGKEGYASDYDVKSIAEKGHHIAAHTYSHVPVTEMSSEEVEDEIVKNIEVLKELTGLDIFQHFSYPYGEISIQSKRLLRKWFQTMRSIFPGINVGKMDMSVLRAEALIDNLTNKKHIESVISRAMSLQGWLIFYTHDISDNPSPWGASINLYEFVLRKVQSTEALVLNVENAYEYICNSTKARRSGVFSD